MWGGEFADGIQFVYEAVNSGEADGSIVCGPLVGNSKAKSASSSPSAELVLLRDEFVTGLSGRKGAWTDCIRLETNFGRQVLCGGSGGGAFHVVVPAKSEIRAISFSVGDHLSDAIAFVGEAMDSVAANEYVLCESFDLVVGFDLRHVGGATFCD